jgi:hypothetical protein
LTFPEYLYARVAEGVEGFAELDVDDIYTVSLYCWCNDDDLRQPALIVGHNSETQVAAVLSTAGYRPEADEARWNYAYWLQDMPVVVGDPDDPTGVRLAREWIEQAGLWYSDEQEEADFDTTLELGGVIVQRFWDECLRVARRLHDDGVIRKAFGRSVPVIVHDLEYEEYHADAALAGNPPELVADYIAWVLR